MTAENQVAKEVAEIGEKSGLDMSPNQDLPKPNCNGSNHCDQVNGLEDSYIYVTEANGLSDDSVVEKADLVAAKGLSVESKVPVDVQIEKLDLLDKEVIESVKVGAAENVERSIADLPVVNGNGTPLEVEKLPVNGDGIPAVADAPEEENEETESHVVTVIKSVEVPNVESLVEADLETVVELNGNSENIIETEIKAPVLDAEAVIAAVVTEEQSEETESHVVAVIKAVEVPIVESSVEADTEAAVELNGNSENIIETEIKPPVLDGEAVIAAVVTEEQSEETESHVVAVIKSVEVPDVESFVEAEIEASAELNENLENIVEAEIKPPVLDGEAVIAAVVTEEQCEEAESHVLAVIKSVEVPDVESLVEAEIEVASELNGNSENIGKTEIKLPVLDGEAVTAAVVTEDQSEKAEIDVVAEIKSYEVPNGRIESLVESYIDAVVDQIVDSEIVVETEVKPLLQDGEDFVAVSLPPIEDPKSHSEETESGVVAESKSFEVPNGRLEVLLKAETDAIGEQNHNVENVVELVIEPPIQDAQAVVTVAPEEQKEETESDVAEIKLDESPNGTPENLAEVETVAVEEENVNSENVAEIEIRPSIQYDESVVTVPRRKQSEETESNVVAEIGSVEVQNGRPESLVGVETETAATEEQSEEIESDAVANIESVEVPNGRPGSLIEVETETVAPKEQNEETKSDVVAEIESVEVSNGRPGSSVEVKTETVLEQNGNSENVVETEIKSPVQDAEAVLTVGSPPIQDPESQVFETGNPGPQESQPNYTNSDPNLGSEFAPNVDDFKKKELAFECSDEHVENEVVNEALEDLVHGSSAFTTEVLKSDVTGTCGDEPLDGFDITTKDPSNLVLQKEDSRDLQGQLDTTVGSNDETSCLQENASSEKSESNIISTPSPEDSSTDVILGGDTSIVAETKPLFTCVVKVPRFGDESLKERIRLAKEKVDETTKVRDDIQVQIQEKRHAIQTRSMDCESAKREDRNARRLVKAKRMEIDSIQSVINKAKNATSVEDIDNQICGIEYRIQHETVPLKEEKYLIREIKRLKQLREQLSASLGTADEIEKALEQRGEAEKHLKILWEELDVLKDNVVKAEAITLEAERKYDNEIKEVKELQVAYRAADDVRQETFAQWLSVKKELTEKNNFFFKYRDDAAAASNYGQKKQVESVYRVCGNQIETMMELWNTNVEFRKEYINSNVRSTVRRFGCLDGRTINPNEKPHVLLSDVNERFQRRKTIEDFPTPAAKVEDSTSQSPPELNVETSNDKEASDDKPLKKSAESKVKKIKEAAKPVLLDNGSATVSGRDAEVAVEEPVISNEEIELAKKAEEIRKSEAEALRKQRLAEERTRADEAHERKKRQAEKLQARALMKAQKEAEQKEKEREKRMRKKERKKNVGTNVSDNDNHFQSGETTVEATKEIIPPTSVVNNKKPPQKSKKQIKSKSTIPPPLRNRKGKKWQQYMYVGAACFLVLVLFLIGNMGFFSAKKINYSNPSA